MYNGRSLLSIFELFLQENSKSTNVPSDGNVESGYARLQLEPLNDILI